MYLLRRLATYVLTIFGSFTVAFIFFRMGKASALAWILFIVIVLFTILLFRSSRRWVYYGGE